MVEHRGGVEQHLKDQHCQRRCPKKSHHGELDAHRNQDFQRMEAQPRGDIELLINMVHAMQPPQPGSGMEEAVLEVVATSSMTTEMTTEMTTANHIGTDTRLKRPQPCSAAIRAAPTAASGKNRRTAKVSRTTMARLLGQRWRR